MKIKELSTKVRSKIQSGLVITDAVQCVLELVYNSLDAEATAIAVFVDLNKYKIQVVDNGKGIEKSDLELVGERYMTSKYYELEETNYPMSTYGCRGQALSSILDVCKILKIETKTEGGDCFVKVFERNRAMRIEEKGSCSVKNGSGTTVTVFDFLCTMPVRRKRINEVFDLEEMKKQLQYLAVIHNEVSFTLRNENKNLILLQKHSTSTMLQSVSQVYKNDLTQHLKPVYYQDQKFEISGFVSTKQRSQNLQLLYMNKRIVTKGIIHKFINAVLKEYFVDVSDESFSDVVLKKMKKKICNVFVIQIKCSKSYYELYCNLRKTTVEFKNWKEVLKCVHKAIRRVFKSNDSSTKSDFESSNSGRGKGNLKKNLGVSLLNNVVKGACVKRQSNEKQSGGKSGEKIHNSEHIFVKPEDKTKTEPKSIKNNAIDCTSDSLESPIPKKCFGKKLNLKEKSFLTINNPNESFLQFYEWLKLKFEKDAGALNLYNEFLKVKKSKREEESKYKSIVFKSSIVGGKLKNVSSKDAKNVKKLTKLTVIKSQKEKTLHLKNRRNVFHESKHVSAFENLSRIEENNYVSEVSLLPYRQALLEASQQNNCSFSYHKVFHHHQQTDSPVLSEGFLKNLITFRNKTESINCSFTQMQSYQDTNVSFTQTWTSHYMEERMKNYLKNNGVLGGKLKRKSEPFVSNTKLKSRNAQVQTNFGKISKTNASVQTSIINTLNKSIQQSFTDDRFNESVIASDRERSFAVNSSNEEVPYPDFWNLSPEEIDGNEKKGSKVLEIQRAVSSNDLICGQDSNPKSYYTDSTSKEKQTVAVLIRDCRRENIEESKSFEQNFENENLMKPTDPKSNIKSYTSSTSKETRTAVALMTDCLNDVGNIEETRSCERNFEDENSVKLTGQRRNVKSYYTSSTFRETRNVGASMTDCLNDVRSIKESKSFGRNIKDENLMKRTDKETKAKGYYASSTSRETRTVAELMRDCRRENIEEGESCEQNFENENVMKLIGQESSTKSYYVEKGKSCKQTFKNENSMKLTDPESNTKSCYTSGTSKETRTIAALMTDCLNDIENTKESKSCERIFENENLIKHTGHETNTKGYYKSNNSREIRIVTELTKNFGRENFEESKSCERNFENENLMKFIDQEKNAKDYYISSTSEESQTVAASMTDYLKDVGNIKESKRLRRNFENESLTKLTGQKSNTESYYTSSTSKETRTIAALMTDVGNVKEIKSCDKNSMKLTFDKNRLLKETEGLIGKLTKDEEGNSKECKKSMSDAESTQLPKTIPIEDIQPPAPDSVESFFYLTERHDFMPKGLSPNFFKSETYSNLALSPNEQNKIKNTLEIAENDLLASIKWEDELTGGSSKPTIPDGILDEMRSKAERNLIYGENETLSASLSYCAVKVHKLLHSFAFTKELLSNVEVLGQLDKKFIVAKMEVAAPKKMTLVTVFDQHAVDERIKLEELFGEYLTSDGKLIPSSVNPHIKCKLNKPIIEAVGAFTKKLKHFGLCVKIESEKSVVVEEIPKFLLDRHEKNSKMKSKSSEALVTLIEALITNVVNEAAGSRGILTKVPKIIHNALCSEACRRAIKFNKFLTNEDMAKMISKLSNCKLPFQCAHGRPSVIPLIDLEDFEVVEDDTVDRDSLRQFFNKRHDEDS